MHLFYAIFLGLLFGFILQKVGAANPKRIIDMLRLKDFHLMKAILFGIGLSSLLLFVLMWVGVISSDHLSVKASYVGVPLGGALLGAGWALAGFCPGTGVVAAGAGRKDGWFFILGGLVGAFVFMLVYASIKSTPLYSSLGGKMTLVETGVKKYAVLLPSAPPLIVAGGIALAFLAIAFFLPNKKSN